MEQLGGIIFLLVFLVILPGLGIWGIIRYFRDIFREIKKEVNYNEKKIKEDGNYFESSDGINEYHQYSFYSSSTKDVYQYSSKNGIEVIRETRITYRMFPFTETLLGKYRYSEVVIPIQNPRYNLKNKIVITENFSKIQKIGIYIVAFIINLFSIIVILGFLGIIIGGIGGRLVGNLNDEFVTPYILGFFGIMSFTIVFTMLFGRFRNISAILSKISHQGMESLGFEDSFDAFSMDSIEVRMIITPAFMDRLEQLNTEWNLKKKMRIIWKNNNITIIIKGDIEKYGLEGDGNYTLINNIIEKLNIKYYSLNETTK